MRLRLLDRMPNSPALEYRRWWWMVSVAPLDPPNDWWVKTQIDGVAIRVGRWIYMLRWRQPI